MENKLKPLVLGDLEIKIPIIQGGMGVRVSTAPLAAAAANCGIAGTIASVGLPLDTPENRKNVPKSSREHLEQEIRRARELSDGVIGVNIMVALSNYEDLVRTCVKAKADYIISGAGMPISLPEFTEGSDIKLIPIVASARGTQLILKTWKRRYNKSPDALVVEGPMAGGHLAGYSLEKLIEFGNDLPGMPLLENDFKEILTVANEYGEANGVKIPVIAAGGVFDGKDMAKFIKMGAGGVQMATRFVATCECSADQKFKDAYINAKAEDVVHIQSPVGMPAKAIRTKFIEDILRGERKSFTCNYRCLRTCDPSTVQYCIAKALINAVEGDIDNAVVLAGDNVTRIDKIIPVRELVESIVTEANAALNE